MEEKKEAKIVKVLGLDPGIANFGWCIVSAWTTDYIDIELIEGGVFTTTKNGSVKKPEDNARRCVQIYRHLERVVFGHKPDTIAIEAVAFPFGKTQTSVISNLGRVRGLVDSFDSYVESTHEFTAQKIKTMVAGSRKASKDDVQANIFRTVRGVGAFCPTKKTLHEHYFDSIAAAKTYLLAEFNSTK